MKIAKFANAKIERAENRENGFTLIEMLVSVAIFSLSMIVVSQLFIYSLKAQRILTSHSQLVNEISYNMEHISRGLRMAKKSGLGDNCLATVNTNYEKTTHSEWIAKPPTQGIRFKNPTPLPNTYDCVEYYMGYPDDLSYSEDYHGAAALMEYRLHPDGSSFTLPLTSPDIELIGFNISDAAAGWPQTDDLQPRVTLSIEMKTPEAQSLVIQTTISQRNPDIEWQEI